MDATTAEIGGNLVSKHQRFSLNVEHEQVDTDGTGRPNPFHETKFPGANGDRENSVSLYS